MGWNNPPIPWSDFERASQDAARSPTTHATAATARPGRANADRTCRPQGIVRDPDALPYAELHAHSSYSFLDGASSPEELLEEAERLGLHALALIDHDGFYGIVHFAEAAETSREDGVRRRALARPERSAERRTGSRRQPPAGARAAEEGYHRLATAITDAHLRGGEKGRPVYELEELAAASSVTGWC